MERGKVPLQAVPYDSSYVWVETGHDHSSSHNKQIKNQHVENAKSWEFGERKNIKTGKL